jgi:multiple sugar transport system ATP-binding protein
MDMRTELKRLHHISGATTIYVTHDQVEALTMSTNIAVMKNGVIQQFDTPDRIYHFPANIFVADFIGNPKVNLLEGEIIGKNTVNLGTFKIAVDTLEHAEPGAVEFSAYSVLPSGADSTIVARLGETELTIRVMGISKLQMDQKIWLKFDPQTLNLYDKESGDLITG